LPAKNGDLVTEDDDLDGQIGGVTPLEAQQFEDSDEGEVDKGQGHRSPLSPPAQVATSLLRTHG